MEYSLIEVAILFALSCGIRRKLETRLTGPISKQYRQIDNIVVRNLIPWQEIPLNGPMVRLPARFRCAERRYLLAHQTFGATVRGNFTDINYLRTVCICTYRHR